ncbi:MAG: tryptophan synthase subunit alpha [Halobacteriales archaeon]|nr:tryptophan synthase subunit alpha [Halobacteriales archaeon]
MLELPDEPALIPYFVAGYPSVESVPDAIEAFEAGGADVIEVGLPFSEPIADGPTIQNGITDALENGMTPSRYFEVVGEADADVPLVCMTYYNLIMQRGIGEFVRDCVSVGIEGIIVPDLPVEESGALYEACENHGVSLVFIVAPTTTDERLERIMERVSGFVYLQARLGTTGAREDVSTATYDVLERVRGYDVPKAVGFGVSKREHARDIIRGGADAVVAGSVFVEMMDGGTDGVEEKTRELKQGALEGVEEA